ncbi:MAG: response regulator transcription factor [Verrucomicrobiota bacterium]
MTDSTPIRVLIVDKYELTRIGIRHLLSQHSDFQVVGDTGDSDEALSIYERTHPDLVMLDLAVSGGSGAGMLRRFRESQGKARFYVLSSCEDDSAMIDAFSAGVDGFVNKASTADEVLKSLREVAEGQTVLDPRLTDQVVNFMRSGPGDKTAHLVESLSVQERRVLEHVARGLSNKEVAKALSLSEKTIKNYFSNVLSKLSASRRTEAAVIYWKYESSR